MAIEDIDITRPIAATDVPSSICTRIQNLASGLQEYLDVDHFCELNGNLFPTEAAGAGKHRQITFQAVLGAAPTADTGEGILYTYTADAAVELFWEVDGHDPRQLTKAGRLNLIEADFATVIDADTILSFDDGGELTLVVDDDTIEYDETNGLQIKVPDNCEAEFLRVDTYAGNGASSRDIAVGTGLIVRHVVVKEIGANYSAVEMVNDALDGSFAWAQTNGSNQSAALAPTVGGGGFTVNNSNPVNRSGTNYIYVAHCVRA
jgi:hypothetical protein